jgi:hypothetical protein
MAPVAEKAQQEPQSTWFLTRVTTPFSRQSTCVGSRVAASSRWAEEEDDDDEGRGCGRRPIFRVENSSKERSANSLMATV